MTEVSPDGFAFVQLRRSVTQRPTGFDSRETAYQLGRTYEARILAAQGVALGIFNAEEARRFLTASGDRSSDTRISDDDYERMPSHLDTEQLLEIWADVDPQQEIYQQFNRTLALRTYIDNSPIFGNFYKKALFATDPEWETAKEDAGNYYDEFSTSPRWSPVLIDGAHKASCACADALGLLAGSPDEYTAPWPDLIGDQLPVSFSGFGGLLSKFNRPYKETVEITLSSMRKKSREADKPPDGAYVLQRLLYGMLELWAATPDRRDRPDGPDWFGQELDVRAALATPAIGTLAYNLDLGLPWACLLWRLAPMDERTLTRYGEAVDLTLRYLRAATQQNP